MNTVDCYECGSKISVTPSRFANRNRFFCSKKCESKYRIKNCNTKVVCSCHICKKEVRLKRYKFENRTNKDIVFCSRKCLGKFNSISGSGRNNPNCKYTRLDDDFFKTIDSEEKAYLLGWIASDGSISKSGFVISIHQKDIAILKTLRNIICTDIPIAHRKTCMVSLSVNSKIISQNLCYWLNIVPGKKDKTVCFPKNIPSEHKIAFIRGLFDGDGTISNPYGSKKYKYPGCRIASYSEDMKSGVSAFMKIPCNITTQSIDWSCDKAMNFLDMIYGKTELCLTRKKTIYEKWKEIRITRKSSPFCGAV